MIDERHYTVQELAELWHVSPDTIRRFIRKEPGVLSVRRVVRVPQSVAERVYRKLQQPAPIRLTRTVARKLPGGAVVLIPKEHSVAE